jgi:hypothetical protein
MRKLVLVLALIIMAGAGHGMTFRTELSGPAIWSDSTGQKIISNKAFQINLYATNNDTIPYAGAKRTYWVSPFKFSGKVTVQWGDTATIIVPQFRAFWDDLAMAYYESWDGKLPDIYSFAGSASVSGTAYSSGLGEIHIFSWPLKVLSPSGSLCIGIGNAADDAYDWLFENPIPPFSNICWEVGPEPINMSKDSTSNNGDN